jgi:hypothetical protein
VLKSILSGRSDEATGFLITTAMLDRPEHGRPLFTFRLFQRMVLKPVFQLPAEILMENPEPDPKKSWFHYLLPK